MHQIRKRLTYANVVGSLALFLVLAGGSAFAASQLGKNSVGTKQLKANAVTAGKIKKSAVTAAKIKNDAVTGAKIKNGAITGAKIDTATLGAVPVSATTESVRSGHGTLALGQEKPIFEYGGLKITMKCATYGATEISSRFFISSSTANSVFTSWEDVSSSLGPETPESERELNQGNWASSPGKFNGEPPFDTGGSAMSANGQAFNFWIGEGAEKDSNLCYYWLTANILN